MIGIIGFGNMGRAIASRIGKKIFVSDAVKKKILKGVKATWLQDNIELARRSNIIIIAVKPQDIEGVLEEISNYAKDKLIISIAAGVTTKVIEDIVGKVSIVRVMPNMPIMVGKGISAICVGRYASLKDLAIVRDIFSNIGEVVEVSEDKMNAITAMSGSGPAYYFLFTYLLGKAGKHIGLDKKLRSKLATATFIGAAELARTSDVSMEGFIQKIASKKGTTEAALKVFKKRHLERIIKEAVRAAKNRARELSIA